MFVYRIARSRWINDLSGSGISARWNEPGSRMLYTASSLALALLEILVHVQLDQVPDYMWTSANVPENWIADLADLDDITGPQAAVGTKWLLTGTRVALRVPSVIVPEKNILLNPNHTDFASIYWQRAQDLEIDPRLLRVPVCSESAPAH